MDKLKLTVDDEKTRICKVPLRDSFELRATLAQHEAATEVSSWTVRGRAVCSYQHDAAALAEHQVLESLLRAAEDSVGASFGKPTR
jgi:hypothetical protein